MTAGEGDRVHVQCEESEFEGIVMPSADDSLVLKLESGYNVGFDPGDVEVETLEEDVGGEGEPPVVEREQDSDLPDVSLISTGGTIASTVDYRTGAVTAQFTADDVLQAVPELGEQANYRGRVVTNILSENMTPGHWQEIARAVYEEIEEGADGVVVMHGTDTMAYTASGLAFMLDTPVPVVFVGSQRSADRPSSDNVVNAVCAVEAAKSDVAEVMICMHRSRNDDECSLHRATRARKNHTSRRDAFETVGAEPLGRVDYESREVSVKGSHVERGEQELSVDDDLIPAVQHVKFTPGKDVDIVDSSAEGLVLEGTGLGHVNSDWIETVAEFEGPVVMTSQCLEGRVCDRVYDVGRDLLEAGVVEAEDTLPETAYVKLMWALANCDDPEAAMGRDVAGEITESSRPWT